MLALTLLCWAIAWGALEMQWRSDERHALDSWGLIVRQARAEVDEDEARWR